MRGRRYESSGARTSPLKCHASPARGGSLSQFEFLFSLYGLLLGLGVAELANGFSRVYDKRKIQPIGWLAPGLAALLVSDLLTFWLTAWRYRDWDVTYLLTFGATAVGLVYYFAASQVFPREGSDISANDHAMSRRRLLALSIFAINLAVFFIPAIIRMFEEDFSTSSVRSNALNAVYASILVWIAFAPNKKWAAVAAWCGVAFFVFGIGLFSSAYGVFTSSPPAE